MKGCIRIAITLCFFSCNEEVDFPADDTVHLAGFLAAPVGNSGGTIAVASYWKDGAYTGLTHDSIYSQVTSLYVDGSSVLIGGWKIDPPSRSVIWLDGTETVIEGAVGDPLIALHNNNLFGVWHEILTGTVFYKNGTSQPIVDTALNIGPTGLALMGDDMYISGSSEYHDWTSPNAPTYQNAQCWKNGQVIFKDSENSNAMSIFVHQNDIYMAGYLHDIASSTITACYWKNGQRTDLNVNATARSIFVTDEHVYVAGMIIDKGVDKAVYWKDGEVIALTTEGTFSMANSIFVKGTDVHVGGYEHGYPAYWKNDIKQNIVNQDRRGQIKFVVVGSN